MIANPWSECDRCGEQWRASEMREEWSKLLVCPKCRDPRPEQLDPPRIDPREGGLLPDATFDPEPVFADDGAPVLAADL